jgi:two-component system chemotaxis response regulator CheB
VQHSARDDAGVEAAGRGRCEQAGKCADSGWSRIHCGRLPPRPSADLLLVTLAVSCGPRALAVVLTGAGTDGQASVHAIVHRRGTVFAQAC